MLQGWVLWLFMFNLFSTGRFQQCSALCSFMLFWIQPFAMCKLLQKQARQFRHKLQKLVYFVCSFWQNHLLRFQSCFQMQHCACHVVLSATCPNLKERKYLCILNLTGAILHSHNVSNSICVFSLVCSNSQKLVIDLCGQVPHLKVDLFTTKG